MLFISVAMLSVSGLAGVAYFLADIQEPSKAGFPAYNLQL